MAEQDPDTLDKEQQQARLAKEQADAKAMDNAERPKELASLPDIGRRRRGRDRDDRGPVAAVGAEVAKGDTKLRARVDAEINNILTDLSMARIEEARGGSLDEDKPEEEGAA
ncbi:hypothetical protein [Sphingomonas sp. S2-65]|uniref:hypothetical protein n=1 Tax=Sphingomonas sp. S2-65 TaxID=2903960 RepID=UPI001F48ED3F|nr:hypothetical protein [Sphingomonas sp. S2-65]UYY57096.1 hypothetical protein LZ586_10390 [Sphingomonas sp. S2-65]